MILIVLMFGALMAIIFTMSMRYGFLRTYANGLKSGEAALRYPYMQLNAKEKKLYAALCDAMEHYREILVLPAVYPKSVYERVYLLMTEQEPEYFYIDDIYETADQMATVNLFYDVNETEVKSMKTRLEYAADQIAEKANAETTVFGKLTVIHDEICKGCKYSDGAHQNDAYGCLVEGKAKCEGYAKAFLYTARRAGLPVMNVTGTNGNGENHVWNIAEIDGSYYNIDVTWDDDEAFRGKIAHSCFAVSDEGFEDHIADLRIYQPPACTDDTNTWYHQNGLVAADSLEFAELIRNWQGDKAMVELLCEDELIYDRMAAKITGDSGVSDAVMDLCGATYYQAVADEPRRVIALLPS